MVTEVYLSVRVKYLLINFLVYMYIQPFSMQYPDVHFEFVHVCVYYAELMLYYSMYMYD